MTAIAGCVIAGDPEASGLACNASLVGLPEFLAGRRTRQLGDAAFGCSHSLRLPEDISDHQPLASGRRFLLVADLRLDNREDLISTLAIRPELGKILSDADILLSAWDLWQHESLDRIIGDFAFAIYDRELNSLTLARDPTGQCPLYYSQGEGFAAFASMPSGLLASSLIRREFDVESLAAKLLGFTDVGDATSFAGVKRVEPGHVITIIDGTVHRRRYFCPPITPLNLPDAAFLEAYNQHFSRAVEARLRRRRGELAVHLSSGFDSSAVAVFATEVSSIRPVAFTSAPRVGFNGPVPRGRDADESSLAAKTAQMLGLSHRIVRSTGRFLSTLRRDARLYQEPDRNIVNMDWWSGILSAARQKDATVLLTGTLGNLTIHAGGLPVLAQWLETQGWRIWWREARAARRIAHVRWRGILFNSFSAKLPRWTINMLERTFHRTPKAEETNFLRKTWRGRAQTLARAEHSRFSHSDYNADRFAVIDSQDRGLFRLGALIESGIDERDPTADRRLIEFSFRLPPDQMLRNGLSRPLMRRALAQRLPLSILNNPNRGLQGADWYENLRKDEVLRILDEVSGSTTVDKLIDLDLMRRTLESWPSDRWSDARIISIYRRAFTLTLSTAVFIDEFERMMTSGDFRDCFSSETTSSEIHPAPPH